jgi:hypothetical protein
MYSELLFNDVRGPSIIWNGHYESMSSIFVFFSKKYDLNFIFLLTLDEIFPRGITNI